MGLSVLSYNLSKKKSDEISLVLHSIGIEHVVESFEGRWDIQVDDEIVEHATKEIKDYEKRNNITLPINKIKLHKVNRYLFLTIISSFILFHFFTYLDFSFESITFSRKFWLNSGSTSAYFIMSKGEWFRNITALTLHKDFAHLLSNMIFGGITLYGLWIYVGRGVSLFLIFLSGFFGNYLNAYLHKINHISIGASTAVFGGLGVIAGLQLVGYFKQKGIFQWLPMIAASILFGLLGTGGIDTNTDVGAHLTGFFIGIVIGFLYSLIYSLYLEREKLNKVRKNISIINRSYQNILFIGTIFIVVFSWIIAI